MTIHYRTQGFILKKTDQGEADQLLTVYTKDFGRLEILTKAVRKIKSKLRAGAELFYLSEIEFIQGRGRKTLTDAALIKKFANFGKDLKKLRIAHKIAQVFDDLVKGQEKDENLWNLLNETFSELNDCSPLPARCSLIYYFFLWNLLSFLGYEPELYHCVLCQKKLTPQKLFFSPKEGGIVCEQCRNLVKSIKETDIDAIKILRILLKKDWQTLSTLKNESGNFLKLKDVSEDYHSYISEELKTSKIN